MPFIRGITFIAIAAITLALSSVKQAHAEGQDKSVIGKWKLTKVLDSAAITSLDDDEARRLLGKIVYIDHNRFRFGSDTCLDPDFEVKVVETVEYFRRELHARVGNLGLPDPVTVVDVGCTFVYKKAPDRLVIFWEGFLFEMARQK